jgi:MFS family permease
MMLWSRLSPVRDLSEWEPSFEELTKRNRLLNGIACAFCLAGIFTPLPLFKYLPEVVHGWLVGLGFGLMIILPVLFISLVTLPKGLPRFHEFWRFYELHYKIGLKGIMVVYVPIMILGLVSIYEITKNI